MFPCLVIASFVKGCPVPRKRATVLATYTVVQGRLFRYMAKYLEVPRCSRFPAFSGSGTEYVLGHLNPLTTYMVLRNSSYPDLSTKRSLGLRDRAIGQGSSSIVESLKASRSYITNYIQDIVIGRSPILFFIHLSYFFVRNHNSYLLAVQSSPQLPTSYLPHSTLRAI